MLDQLTREDSLQGPAVAVNLRAEMLDYWDEILHRLPWSAGNSSGPLRTLGITSCARGEGVSTAAVHLAAAAASEPHAHVLLLDANLGAPAAARLLGVAPAPGLAECLFEGEELSGAVQPSPLANLHVLSAGRLRGSPARAYDSPHFTPLLKELSDRFDLVVVDLPAASRASCVFRLAGLLDGVLLVMEADRTTCAVAARMKELLRSARARILGAVLNKSHEHVPNWLYLNPESDGPLDDSE
jgi:Mrp family chromosome partitioning ATPase